MVDFFPKLTVQAKMRKHFKAFKASVFFQERVKDNNVY